MEFTPKFGSHSSVQYGSHYSEEKGNTNRRRAIDRPKPYSEPPYRNKNKNVQAKSSKRGLFRCMSENKTNFASRGQVCLKASQDKFSQNSTSNVHERLGQMPESRKATQNPNLENMRSFNNLDFNKSPVTNRPFSRLGKSDPDARGMSQNSQYSPKSKQTSNHKYSPDYRRTVSHKSSPQSTKTLQFQASPGSRRFINNNKSSPESRKILNSSASVKFKRNNSTERTASVLNSSTESDDEVLLNSKYETENGSDERKSNSDKENDDSQSPSMTNFYSKKKNVRRASILSDISPSKVDKAYGSRSSNVTIVKGKGFKDNSKDGHSRPNGITPITEIITDNPLEIGFLNYGNTCYLNAVLQSLLGLQPFISDITDTVQGLNAPSNSISHSLWRVIIGRHNTDVTGIRKSLRNIKENLERIDGSFSGFKMQDANEFLTQVLDTVKDEIDRCFNIKSENKISSTVNKELVPSTKILTFNTPSFNTSNVNTSPNTPETGEIVTSSSIFDTPNSDRNVSLELRLKGDEGYTSSDEHCPDSDKSSVNTNNSKDSDNEAADLSLLTKSTDSAMDAESGSGNTSSDDDTPRHEQKSKENPVNKNFEFELLESYRCLGCGHVEGRRQSHYALYVNLPNEEGEESIQEAVDSYMGEDNRELTCSKCKHERSMVTTSFTKLPRILIVQMKRYEYKQDQFECIKVSSKVTVNMRLNVEKLAIDSATLPSRWVPRKLSDLIKTSKESPVLRKRTISPIRFNHEEPIRESANQNHSQNSEIKNISGNLTTKQNVERNEPTNQNMERNEPTNQNVDRNEATNQNVDRDESTNQSTSLPIFSTNRKMEQRNESTNHSSDKTESANHNNTTFRMDQDDTLSISSLNFETPKKLLPAKDITSTIKSTAGSCETTPEKEGNEVIDDTTSTPLEVGEKDVEVLAIKSTEETEKEKEAKELEEVMRRSIEDQGPQRSEQPISADTEEEEFQKAIRLSLQDMGMCYASDDNGVNDQQKMDDETSPTKSEQEGDVPYDYRLLSLISHFGLTTCTGHYVSDVYNCSEAQWFHYDDEVVAKLQEAVVQAEGRQKNGYIFFYVHKDIYEQLSSGISE